MTHSGFIVAAVKRLMGMDFPIISAPAPVWDNMARLRDSGPCHPVADNVVIHLDGMVVDSRETDLALYDKASLLAFEGHPLPLPDSRRECRCEVVLDGVIYTSIFNPGDGRKNWPDMILAFCIAFRDVADATLVLKLTHYDVSQLVPEMLEIIHRCGEVACRVVMLHGYLEQDSYEQLLQATSYPVNTSMGEGQCLLMDTCRRQPGIAQRTVRWPITLRKLRFRTLVPAEPRHGRMILDRRCAPAHRLDFGSLVAAYAESYRIAKQEPGRYAVLSQGAISSLQGYCSRDVVRDRLRQAISAQFALHKGGSPQDPAPA